MNHLPYNQLFKSMDTNLRVQECRKYLAQSNYQANLKSDRLTMKNWQERITQNQNICYVSETLRDRISVAKVNILLCVTLRFPLCSSALKK